jgi:hypothetical protein
MGFEFVGLALVAWIISPPIGPAIEEEIGVELLAFGLAIPLHHAQL